MRLRKCMKRRVGTIVMHACHTPLTRSKKNLHGKLFPSPILPKKISGAFCTLILWAYIVTTCLAPFMRRTNPPSPHSKRPSGGGGV